MSSKHKQPQQQTQPNTGQHMPIQNYPNQQHMYSGMNQEVPDQPPNFQYNNQVQNFPPQSSGQFMQNQPQMKNSNMQQQQFRQDQPQQNVHASGGNFINPHQSGSNKSRSNSRKKRRNKSSMDPNHKGSKKNLNSMGSNNQPISNHNLAHSQHPNDQLYPNNQQNSNNNQQKPNKHHRNHNRDNSPHQMHPSNNNNLMASQGSPQKQQNQNMQQPMNPNQFGIPSKQPKSKQSNKDDHQNMGMQQSFQQNQNMNFNQQVHNQSFQNPNHQQIQDDSQNFGQSSNKNEQWSKFAQEKSKKKEPYFEDDRNYIDVGKLLPHEQIYIRQQQDLLRQNDPMKMILDQYQDEDGNRSFFIPYSQFLPLDVIQQELIYRSLCQKILTLKQLLDPQLKTKGHGKIDEALMHPSQVGGFQDEAKAITELHLNERSSNKQTLARFMQLIEQQKDEIIELKKKIEFMEKKGTQVQMQQTTKYGQSQIQEYKDKKYQQQKFGNINQGHNQSVRQILIDIDGNEQDNKLEQRINELKVKVCHQLDEGKTIELGYNNEITQLKQAKLENRNAIMDLINQISELRKQLADTTSSDEKKVILSNIDLIDKEYKERLARKDDHDDKHVDIEERFSKVEQMVSLTQSFLEIYEQFKKIHDYLKTQKYKLSDYEHLFTKLREDNESTLTNYRDIEIMKLQKLAEQQ